jgi:hypothetical protein
MPRACRPLFWWTKNSVILLDMSIKTQKHTSKAVLFGFLRQNKMWGPVAFVPEPCRKTDKKTRLSFGHTNTSYFRSLSFLQHQLQHQINRQWQMTAFQISRNNGNSIIASRYFYLVYCSSGKHNGAGITLLQHNWISSTMVILTTSTSHTTTEQWQWDHQNHIVVISLL